MTEVLDKDTIKALGADTRQEIIKLLSKRPYTASEISKIMNKHVTTITEHLNTLEKTGLIKRKQNGNKWVYYALSDKGERLFKPKFYTWVIVLSISAIFLFAGIFQIFTGYYGAGSVQMLEKADARGDVAAPSATEEMLGIAATTEQTYDYSSLIGIILIILAIIGFAWFIRSYRKSKKQELSIRVKNITL